MTQDKSIWVKVGQICLKSISSYLWATYNTWTLNDVNNPHWHGAILEAPDSPAFNLLFPPYSSSQHHMPYVIWFKWSWSFSLAHLFLSEFSVGLTFFCIWPFITNYSSGFLWQINAAEHDGVTMFTTESLKAQTRCVIPLKSLLKHMHIICL